MKWRNPKLDRALALAPWIVGALFGGVALHLIAILALPTLAPGTFYNRLAARLALGEVALLPNPSPSAAASEGGAKPFIAPFADPFASLALCRFDLRAAPLRVRASADGERLFGVSVRLADGATIYSATDRQAPQGRFNLLLVTQAQADALDEASQEANQDKSETSPEDVAAKEGKGGEADELRLILPKTSGFVLFRVLSLRESDYAEAAARRATISCTPEKSED